MPVIVSGGSSTTVRVVDGRTVKAVDARASSVVSDNRQGVALLQSQTKTVQSGALGVQGPVGPAGADAGEPVTASYVNGGLTTLRRGQPATIVAGQLFLAKATVALGEFVGLVYDVEIVPGAAGRVQVAGVMQQPAAEWEAATGMVGGLSAGSDYYLSETGGMTPFPPISDGLLVAPVGYATSNTEFLIEPGTSIEL